MIQSRRAGAQAPATLSLLDDFSLEITGKDAGNLREAAASVPAGSRINVTYLANEDPSIRVAAAATIHELGCVAVPHVSARRLTSATALDEFLAALAGVGAAERLLVVAGDAPHPAGPFEDSLAVIGSGSLQRHGVREVSVAGYPEGHPKIDDGALWSSLERKLAMLAEQDLAASIVTQFGFDADRALDWTESARDRGIDAPVRVGLPGPTGVRRLLAYAARFGVASGATVARKYGLSLTNLLSTAGPDRFLDLLAGRYDAGRHGELRVHFFTFGGVAATVDWVSKFRQARGNS